MSSFALVAHAVTPIGNNTTIATPSRDTTGAGLIVLILSRFRLNGTVTLSDNKSNTWTPLTLRGSSGADNCTIYYCINPIVGAGHIFNFTSSGTAFPSLAMLAFSVTGVIKFDQETGATNSLTLPTLTPSANDSLFIAALETNNVVNPTVSINSGFTITDNSGTDNVNNVPTVAAYLLQATAAPVGPVWTISGGSPTPTAMAVFVIDPNSILSVTKSDSLTLSDLIASTLGMVVSDTFTLSDLLRYGLSIRLSSSDSLALSDAIVFIINILFGKSDALSFSDVLKLGASVSRQLGDNILLSDFLAALITQLPSYSDTFGLSDSARLTLSLGLSQNDSLALLDAVKIAIVNNLILNQTDSLSLSDSVQFDLSSNLDQYIRHYLNDVLR